ncbi:putative membrane protein [Campylobacter sp. RM5004]|uniref:hypothetical protein n=1 Tax=Campylobacter sp. RM5004 TaxID=1660078 RepID=UPI001EFB2B6A|nr:hypothetical protein [Campylobacter sp. RM5004]ULO00840.1 putative membrane protein [Campylobacter sp. RM5004]
MKTFLNWLISEIKSNEKSFIAFSFSIKKLNIYYYLFFVLYLLIKPDDIAKIFRVFIDEKAIYKDIFLLIPFVGLQIIFLVVFIPSFIVVLFNLLIDKDKINFAYVLKDFFLGFAICIHICFSILYPLSLATQSNELFFICLIAFVFISILLFIISKENMHYFFSIILYLTCSLLLYELIDIFYILVSFLILLIISVCIRLRSIYLLLLLMPLIFHYFIEFAHGYFTSSEGVIEPLKHLAVMLSIFVIIIVYNRLNNKS